MSVTNSSLWSSKDHQISFSAEEWDIWKEGSEQRLRGSTGNRNVSGTTLDTRRYQQVLVYDAAAETVGIDIDSDAI